MQPSASPQQPVDTATTESAPSQPVAEEQPLTDQQQEQPLTQPQQEQPSTDQQQEQDVPSDSTDGDVPQVPTIVIIEELAPATANVVNALVSEGIFYILLQ